MSQANANPSGPGLEPRRRSRAATVTLRQGATERVQSVNELMDPANKSLADALKIAYRLLIIAIGVMVLLYILSGFQTIGPSERGLRVRLGKADPEVLQPGPHFAPPQPFGNIIRTQIDVQRIDEKKAFYPALSETEEKTLADSANGTQSLADGGRDALDPDNDGMLLTGDGFIVHTRWQVTYRRQDNDRPFRAIASDSNDRDSDSIERRIITAALRRGVVIAAANSTIDEVLNNQPQGRPSGTLSFSEMAKIETQKLLDQMSAGIEIDQFNMTVPIPPRHLMKDFYQVQSAQSQAAKALQDALGEQQVRLTRAAGDAAPLILKQIDLYEEQLAAGKTADANATLDRIQKIMLRQPVQIEGVETMPLASGEVSTMLSEAEQYRTSVVERARGDAAAFAAKLSVFRSNPQVYLNSEWTSAFGSLLGQSSVQAMMLPDGLERLTLMINRDPAIAKQQEADRQQREAEEAQRERNRLRQKQLFDAKFNGEGATEQ